MPKNYFLFLLAELGTRAVSGVRNISFYFLPIICGSISDREKPQRELPLRMKVLSGLIDTRTGPHVPELGGVLQPRCWGLRSEVLSGPYLPLPPSLPPPAPAPRLLGLQLRGILPC